MTVVISPLGLDEPIIVSNKDSVFRLEMSHTRKRSHSRRSIKSFPLRKKSLARLGSIRNQSRSLSNFEEDVTTSPTVHKFIAPRLETAETKLTLDKKDHTDAVDRLRVRIDYLESQMKTAKKAKKEELVKDIKRKLSQGKFQLKVQLKILEEMYGLTY
jgi:hypothetical protein